MSLFSPAELAQNYCAAGKAKAERTLGRTFLLSVLAGFFIAAGAAFSLTVSHSIQDVSTARLLAGLAFAVGLPLVLLMGAELFTGNSLICITVLNRETTLMRMLRNWAIVYVGNFAGALLLAALCVYGGQFNYSAGGLAVYAIKVAETKCALSFGPAVALGFLCNVLVCAGVLCGYSAKDTAGRILGAYLPVALFVSCGYEHSVANMFYIPAGLLALGNAKYAALAAGAGINLAPLTWGGFLLNNLLPVTIGNILGGLAVAFVMWGGHLFAGRGKASCGDGAQAGR